MIKLEDGDYAPEECCTFGRNFETGEMEVDDVSLPCGCDCSRGGTLEISCESCVIQKIMNEYGEQEENRWIPVSERLPENEREKVMVMTPSGTTVGWYAKKAFSKGWATEYKKVWHILYFYDIEPWCLTSNFDYYRNPKIYTLENEKVRSLQVLAWKPLKEMFKNFDPCVTQGILEEMKETGEKND